MCKPNFAKDDDTSSAVRATWIGHATVLADIGNTAVITYPIVSDRANKFSFAGLKRYLNQAKKSERSTGCHIRL